MSQKKVVGRSVAIALGIICILLIAALGVVLFMSYSPTANSLQSTYNNYVNGHSHTNDEYNSLNSQNTNLQGQVSDLSSTLNLGKSTVWVNDQTQSQPAGGIGFAHSTWTESASYAGYVTVYVLSATSTIYVDVIYTSHGLQYSNEVNVGTTGTAVFSVLPATMTIEVGNRNLLSGSTETVTITYYY